LPLLAGADGAGAIGELAPEPVVLGAGPRIGALLPVVDMGAGLLLLLLAVLLLLLLQPAMTTNAISASTARPAIQPHAPPMLSPRRKTGSPSRGSL
jgi:hypothetical protein